MGTADLYRMTVSMPLGKLPPDPTKPALALTGHLYSFTAAPTARDWLSKVTSWPMYGNDQYGDCVWAMIGHAIKAWTTYANSPVELTLDTLLKGYSDVTGFDPHNPDTDQGTLLQDALNYWRKTGIAGHKILAFAKVDHTDPAEIQAAINTFGAVMMGINFPSSAMRQFRAHRAWTVVSQDGGIEGGHAIHAGQYDSAGYKVTTWGDVQSMDNGFAKKYLDEAWCVVTPEWLTAAGSTVDGLDLQGLGEAFASLTGETNPFPPAPPAPTPNDPHGPVTTVDSQLALALRLDGWINAPHSGVAHRVARAAQAWLKAHHL